MSRYQQKRHPDESAKDRRVLTPFPREIGGHLRDDQTKEEEGEESSDDPGGCESGLERIS